MDRVVVLKYLANFRSHTIIQAIHRLKKTYRKLLTENLYYDKGFPTQNLSNRTCALLLRGGAGGWQGVAKLIGNCSWKIFITIKSFQLKICQTKHVKREGGMVLS